MVNLELPEKPFICLDVLVKLWSSRSVFGDFFVSSEGLSYPHGTARKFEDIAFIENYTGRFVFTPNVFGDLLFFNNNRNILILKCESTTSENRS